ncbi:MAG TPA: hypothetical protein PLH87_12555 [Bacillota bacterium]|nr:hypothetical protein [Bacillota bacterium]
MTFKKTIFVIVALVNIMICSYKIPIANANTNVRFEVLRDEIEKYMSKVAFYCDPNEALKLNNGILLYFRNPITEYHYNYQHKKSTLLSTKYYCYLSVKGMRVSFKNETNKIMIIRWRESLFKLNDLVRIPLLGEVQFEDANKPVTPDTVIIPGQTITKVIYIPRTNYVMKKRVVNSYYDYWTDSMVYTYEDYPEYFIVGEPIMEYGDIKIELQLKIFDQYGKVSINHVKCPPIKLIL